MLVQKEIHNIFAGIRNVLIRIAVRYRDTNPENTVDSWLSSAYLIAKKYDEKQLKFEDQETESSFDTDSPAFLKYFSAYLKKAFEHSLIDEIRRSRRFVSTEFEDGSVEFASGEYNQSNFDGATIDDMIGLLVDDIVGNEHLGLIDSSVKEVFVYQYGAALVEMKKAWGDTKVIPDLDNKKIDTFFVEGFKEELIRRTKRGLHVALLEHDSPVLINSLFTICTSPGDFALRKRFERYFFLDDRGIALRIKHQRALKKRNKCKN